MVAVPKLFQWLLVLGSSMSVWLAYVAGIIRPTTCKAFHDVILILPLYSLMCFACFSLATIGYRVATFNDCKDASEELRKQIKEAQKDLKKKGFKYTSDFDKKD